MAWRGRTRPILAAGLALGVTFPAAGRLAPSAAGASAAAATAVVASFKAQLLRRHFIQIDPRNGLPDQRLDGGDGLAVLGTCDRIGAPIAACASRAPDAMDVVLGMVRHVEIEDMGQALDVEAARGHVAADQKPDLAVPETLQRLGPLRLDHIAVQRRHVETVLGERAVEDIHVALAVAEDQRVLDVLVLDEAPERLALVHGIDHQERLHHGLGRRGRRRHGDLFRVHQERVGQAPDLRRHGCREEQRLPNLRDEAHDALDVGDEAHVEHAVRLIDHQEFGVRQQDLAAIDQVEEAPGCRDQHVDAAVEFLLLIGEALAADQQRHAELVVVLSVGLEGLRYLCCELASRLQDQRARHARAGATSGQNIEHREREPGRLASAGLGAAQNVAAHEHVGDGLFLDRGGGLVAGVAHGLKNFGRKPEVGKTHQWILLSIHCYPLRTPLIWPYIVNCQLLSATK